MVDFTFDIEIHVGGCFVEEPTIEYVGEFVHLLTEIDLDRLSFFEIRDLCHLVGAPKEHSRYKYLLPKGNLQVDLRDIATDANVLNMTTLYRAWSAEKIIIYTDIDVEPLAVKYPDGGGVAHGGVGGDGGGVADDAGCDVSGDVDGLGGDAVRDEIDLKSDYDEDDENDEEDVEDVEDGARDEEQDVEVGARVEEQNVEGNDNDDWLYEGLEGGFW